MINNQGGTLWDDPNYRWQQQLLNGANIANTGWQTALGLMLGSGLGNWLGHRLGDLQQEKNFQANMTNQIMDNGYSNVTYDKSTRRFSAFDPNGNMFYFNRSGQLLPQPSLYEKGQINSDATNRLTQNFLQNLTPQPTPQLPTQNSYQFNAPNMSGNGYNPPNRVPLYPTDWLNQSTQANNQTIRWW